MKRKLVVPLTLAAQSRVCFLFPDRNGFLAVGGGGFTFNASDPGVRGGTAGGRRAASEGLSGDRGRRDFSSSGQNPLHLR